VINFAQHSFHTRSFSNYYAPQANLTTYQEGIYYAGIKIFSNLPNDAKKSSYNAKKFERVLRPFLTMHSFCSVEEVFNR
jgi:hypothetical protein